MSKQSRVTSLVNFCRDRSLTFAAVAWFGPVAP